jgi:RNA polymerase sigma-70 factor (ECF subfamily)
MRDASIAGRARLDGCDELPPEGDHHVREERQAPAAGRDLLRARRPDLVLRAVGEGELLRRGGDRRRRVRVPVAPEPWADLHARLRAFVARRVGDPHAADDLAQEILLRVHQRLGDLRDGERLDAWAYRIARNAIVDHYRARGTAPETPRGEGLDDAPALDLGDDAERVRAEMAHCLAPLVRRLPDPYREALELTDLGELTQAAAAERLRLTVPGMKARVQRGRGKLRELLLECCEVALDARGRPTEYRLRGTCGCP